MANRRASQIPTGDLNYVSIIKYGKEFHDLNSKKKKIVVDNINFEDNLMN